MQRNLIEKLPNKYAYPVLIDARDVAKVDNESNFLRAVLCEATDKSGHGDWWFLGKWLREHTESV